MAPAKNVSLAPIKASSICSSQRIRDRHVKKALEMSSPPGMASGIQDGLLLLPGPSTVHALLHVADDIEKNGPPCANWSFALERWCGKIEEGVKSRRRPYTSLAYHQLHLAQLYDISNRYNLAEMLCLNGSPEDELSRYEKVYPEFECFTQDLSTDLTTNLSTTRPVLHPSAPPQGRIQARTCHAEEDLRLLVEAVSLEKGSIFRPHPTAHHA
jgi:hypothetical protein